MEYTYVKWQNCLENGYVTTKKDIENIKDKEIFLRIYADDFLTKINEFKTIKSKNINYIVILKEYIILNGFDNLYDTFEELKKYRIVIKEIVLEVYSSISEENFEKLFNFLSNITHPLKIKLRLGNLKVFSNEQLKRLISLESSMESGVKIDAKIDQEFQNCIEENENCNNFYSIEKLSELKDYASTIIKWIPKNYNEVKKVLFIHKYLINDLGFLFLIDGGIPLNRSFSKAFRLLMEELGIECKTIYSDTNYWNVVKLNGAWYHIDVCDDFLNYNKMSRKKNECYLKSEESILKDGKHWPSVVYYSDKDKLAKNSILKVKVPKNNKNC